MTAVAGEALRLSRERSLLVVVDIQARLAPHVAGAAAIIARAEALVAAAAQFAIPAFLTEHCPEQLGPVVSPLRECFAPAHVYAKTRFGAADHAEFGALLRATGRQQAVVAGMEAHVCVMQTSLGLLARGFEVFGSYTHFYKAEAPNRARVLILPLAPGFNKDNTSVGVSYQTPARMLYLNVRTSFVPGAVTALPSATDLRPVYEARHQRWDATLRWRINREYSVEFVGANLTDDSFRETYQGGRITSRRSFGKSFLLTFSANLDQLKLPFIDRDR